MLIQTNTSFPLYLFNWWC